MPAKQELRPELGYCTCLAIRQAARHVTQYYDRHLAPAGLRVTQFSILAKLERKGPMSINELARDMVMDRTTLGRNILPLERDDLIEIAPSEADRRSKELRLTAAGAAKLRLALRGWAEAQAGFSAAFGDQRTKDLRAVLKTVTATELEA